MYIASHMLHIYDSVSIWNPKIRSLDDILVSAHLNIDSCDSCQTYFSSIIYQMSVQTNSYQPNDSTFPSQIVYVNQDAKESGSNSIWASFEANDYQHASPGRLHKYTIAASNLCPLIDRKQHYSVTLHLTFRLIHSVSGLEISNLVVHALLMFQNIKGFDIDPESGPGNANLWTPIYLLEIVPISLTGAHALALYSFLIIIQFIIIKMNARQCWISPCWRC